MIQNRITAHPTTIRKTTIRPMAMLAAYHRSRPV